MGDRLDIVCQTQKRRGIGHDDRQHQVWGPLAKEHQRHQDGGQHSGAPHGRRALLYQMRVGAIGTHLLPYAPVVHEADEGRQEQQ